MGERDDRARSHRPDRAEADVEGADAAEQQLFELRTRVGRHKRSLQRKAERDAKGAVAEPSGSGSALGGGLRTTMERELGADLSAARIHTGTESAKSASALGAKAFTDGHDVHFGAGQFAPGTKEGDRLIAHELTHVVQGQKAGLQRKKSEGEDSDSDVEVSHPHDASEKEADAVGDHVADNLHGGDGAKPAAAGGGEIQAKPSAIGRKIFRSTSTAPAPAKKPGFFGQLFGGGKKVGAADKKAGAPPKEAEQLDPLVKNVRELLDRPIPPDTRKDLEKQWKALEKANAELQKALAGADPALVKQAEAEVDAIRMEASGTVKGDHGQVKDPAAAGGKNAAALAKENWQKAAAMVRGWASSGVSITIDGLRKVNEVLGHGLDNNGGTPGEVRKGEVMTGAKGGGFNPYLMPKDVPAELAAAVGWYQANKAKMKGPELAAKMYQRLVSIHPFMDANGRTCRLAMDWVLQSHGLPPAALQGEEVNVAVFGLDPIAGRDSVDPDHAVKAVTAGIQRTIAIMKRVIAQAKK